MPTRRDGFWFVFGACLLFGGLCARDKAASVEADVATARAEVARLKAGVDAGLDGLAHEVDKLGVKVEMAKGGSVSSAVDDEPALLRRFSRRDETDSPFTPSDTAEFLTHPGITRHNTFDWRPSEGKGRPAP